MKVLRLLLIAVVFLVACDDDVLRYSDPTFHTGEERPAVSPDGSKLAYYGSYDGTDTVIYGRGIKVCDLDGGNVQWTGVRRSYYRWLDTSVVLLRGSSTGTRFELFSAYPDTGVIATCSGDLASSLFDISSGGDTIVYVGPQIDSLWTSSIRMYIRSTGFDTTLVSGEMPSLSPDGRKICYHRSGIRVYDLVTHEDRLAWPDGWYPTWGPDTTTIIFARMGGGITRLTGSKLSDLTWDGGPFGDFSSDWWYEEYGYNNRRHSWEPFSAIAGRFDYSDPYLWYTFYEVEDQICLRSHIFRLDTRTGERLQITR